SLISDIDFEEIPELIEELKKVKDSLSKSHLLYEKYSKKHGSRIFLDVSDKNILQIETYLAEAKKIKSFLWQFTKKAQINDLNQKLDYAFPASTIKNPHSLIPKIESEYLLYKEIEKIKIELDLNKKAITKLLNIDKLESVFSNDKYNELMETLEKTIKELSSLAGLIDQTKILEICKSITTKKSRNIKDTMLTYIEASNFINITQEIAHLRDDLGFEQEEVEVDEENLLENVKFYEELVELTAFISDKTELLKELNSISQSLPLTLKKLSINPENLETVRDSLLSKVEARRIEDLTEYLTNLEEISTFFGKMPSSQYLGDREHLQNRLITNMTSILDAKAITFRITHKADAEEIRKLIRKKSKIPKHYLRTLIEAFPCLIVNIRELGEYIPLEPELFDVVIIDEASQVSIAQAFPALLRAKKVVVLGDTRQFSNVKTAQASIPTNNEAFSLVKESYSSDIKQLDFEKKEAIKDKINSFNIKNSILEFMKFIVNYETMLLKHFRSYPELISYSKEFHYGGRLQVMKVRAKHIDDVVKFVQVEPCDFPTIPSGTTARIVENANENEANYIISELEKLIKNESTATVGIISPFRNQIKYINDLLQKSTHLRDFENKLKLKVMTFDTCQGEERDIIYYSMVENDKNKARLNTIFPSALSGDEEEGKLRVQRLNVGFSRAKECVVFVTSKKIEDFSSQIGIAIRHFKEQLEEGLKLPSPDETESEREKMLLGLIK
ncbi:MAG TPA: AAA domain-containing protein, partial [Patescibacteria group bacterium]